MVAPNPTPGPKSLCLQDPQICQIHLPEDRECTHADSQGHCHCTVWTGGDLLAGTVEVSAPECADFAVDVRLEGFYPTRKGKWQSHDGSPANATQNTSEVRFLQQIDTVKYQPSSGVPSAETKVYQLPFSFVIPKRLISNPPDSDPRLLQLYPTTKLGTHMRPLIYYRLMASIERKDGCLQRWSKSWGREIVIMATQSTSPPIYVDSTQQEYRLNSNVKVRRHLCGRSKGMLQLSADEPLPLNLLAVRPRTSTSVFMNAVFNTSTANSSIEPCKWTLVVRSHLRLRFFYSTKPFDHEPTLADVQTSRQIAMRTKSAMAETREYSNLSWRMDRISEQGTIAKSDDAHLRWTTELQVIVTAPKVLSPSFLAPTLALRHSIVLNVAILGLPRSFTTIEVPVQIVRDPHFLNSEMATCSAWWLPEDITRSFNDLQIQPGDANNDNDDGCDGEESLTDKFEGPPRYRRWTY